MSLWYAVYTTILHIPAVEVLLALSYTLLPLALGAKLVGVQTTGEDDDD